MAARARGVSAAPLTMDPGARAEYSCTVPLCPCEFSQATYQNDFSCVGSFFSIIKEVKVVGAT
eukprot:1292936-Prymnesium_polylepis.1